MKNVYNSWIAHCSGKSCPIANDCKRFHLYKHWLCIDSGCKEHTPFVMPEYNFEVNDCLIKIKI